MMTLRLQIVIAVIILLGLSIVVNMVRRKKIELKYALAWLGAGVLVLVFDCFPQLMDWLAGKLGIASPVNMLFFLGFCFALVIIFVLTIMVSRMSVRIKRLAQEIALYEHEKDRESE